VNLGGPIWLPYIILIIGIKLGAKLEPNYLMNLVLVILYINEVVYRNQEVYKN